MTSFPPSRGGNRIKTFPQRRRQAISNVCNECAKTRTADAVKYLPLVSIVTLDLHSGVGGAQGTMGQAVVSSSWCIG